MRIDIWSDVVCPWCWIGKRRLERALSAFAGRDAVEVRWHAFELDPAAPASREGSYEQRLADKYRCSLEEAAHMTASMTSVGASEGVEFRFDRAQPGSTFDAHRLLHLAGERGVQDAVKERLFRATFTDGLPISDVETLVGLAAEAGLDGAEARAVLTSDAYAAQVRADEAQAAQLRITGVPFFVIDGRYGVSGAQSPDVLLQVLERAEAESAPLQVVGSGAGCEGDACAV